MKIKSTIEVIEDNAGGLTIQDKETKLVANFDHKSQAIESLQMLLEGGDMTNWDTSDSEYYISDEEYEKHVTNGGLIIWDQSDIENFVS